MKDDEKNKTIQEPTAEVPSDATDGAKVLSDATNGAEVPSASADGKATDKAADKRAEEALKATIRKIKASASEEDPKPSSQLSLRTILGGDMLSTEMMRSQIWLFLLIVVFTLVYVAFRYQCQQDMLTIDRLENELKDAKFKALSSSSTLTEKSRETHVLKVLKENKDSLLHQADQPPYIIEVPE